MPRFAAGTTTSSSARRTVGYGLRSISGFAIVCEPSSTNVGRATEGAADEDMRITAGPRPTSPSTVSSALWAPLSSSDSPEQDHQLESRMREIRQSGSEGGGDLGVSPYPYHIHAPLVCGG